MSDCGPQRCGMVRQAESLGMSKVRVSRETTVSVGRAWCRLGGTTGRGVRGRPPPSDTLPSPLLGRPLRRRPGAPVARPGWSRGRRRTNSRGERHGGGAATAAVRAGGARCVEVLREGCATRGERPGRRARPCRVWSVPPPSPGCAAASRMQPASRPGAVSGCPLSPTVRPPRRR